MRRYLFVILIFLSPGVVFSTTINVPGDYSTIQQAIDAAANGDTVQVAMGTYPENINFMGKAITVKSSMGAFLTIIDGASPTIKKNIITGNDNGSGKFTWGAGICCYFDANVKITENTITANSLANYPGGQGGGICSRIPDDR